jgi:hypothetical protein
MQLTKTVNVCYIRNKAVTCQYSSSKWHFSQPPLAVLPLACATPEVKSFIPYVSELASLALLLVHFYCCKNILWFIIPITVIIYILVSLYERCEIKVNSYS